MSRVILFLICAGPLAAATPLKVMRGDLQTKLVLTGRIKAVSGEKIIAPVTDNWQVKIDWMLPEGDIAAPGDVVVRFDNKQDRLNLNQLEQDLVNAEANLRTQEEELTDRLQQFAKDLESSQLDLALAEIDARIPAELQERKEYEKKQLDKLRAEGTLALKKRQIELDTRVERNKLASSRIQIRRLQEEIKQQRETIAKLSLTTQNGGVIVYADTTDSSRKLNIGDTVYPGATIVTIPKLDELELETWLTEQEWVRVRQGMKVAARLDAYPENRLTGRIRTISAQGKEKKNWSRGVYFHTLIELDHVDTDRMKPGMSAQTELLLDRHQDVLLVPLQAIRLEQGAYQVQPEGGEPMTVNPLGWDAFHMAVEAQQNLAEGTTLMPITRGGTP
ncbi:HlyD family secretion protein [Acanthopleuribacter pedis]|uniref:HlyD family efflux transporter periplasmic adaptor subunit n=1 Tax=Acanthopleuribacter pedis TaxID=442870 RepID=A0A8J7U5N7_9BACT|nr:HlyD family efflux transporter periplasmic adaptor subunit [Acanthopleuribacter pedis]MBO1321044.1 HlyD family efflux transporter periplasmic adaptor subunit [Acanthopleuribacter pedis]